jgi:uncharacterized damage-inducible protein DinB
MNENPLRPEEHLEALDKSFRVFLDAASSYPRVRVREKPTEIAFSATEIVYHMLDVERLWQSRMRGILAGTMTHFQQMNPDKEAIEQRYNKKDYEQGIMELTKARIETHELIRSLKPHEFEIVGIHSKYGEMNIHKILETMVNHDRDHAAQLDRTLAQLMQTNNSTIA